jgi:hypothetical protein
MAKLPGPVLLAVGLVCPGLLGAQSDQGVLVVKRGNQEIGRESFRVVERGPGRSSDSIVAIARYPGSRPTTEITAVVDRTAPDALTWLCNRRAGRESIQVLAAVGPNKVTVRVVGQGAESAREYPGARAIVLLDDSLFAPYYQIALLVPSDSASLSALFPRTSRLTTFQARRTPIPAGNRATQGGLQQIRLSGGLTGDIFLDSQGKLVRVVVPELGLEASRVTE